MLPMKTSKPVSPLRYSNDRLVLWRSATHQLLFVFLFASCCPLSAGAQEIEFDEVIAPILVSHCLECHRGEEAEGGLSLTALASIRSGGDSGTALKAGNAMESLLWQRVDSDEMPPNHPLSKTEKESLKQWIDAGAVWGSASIDLFSMTTNSRAGRDWWSLQPLQKVDPPKVDSNWGRNEIDDFIWHRLQTSGLTPSPEAKPRELIRRVYFDLIGLPPTPEQVAEFVADPSEHAYLEIVDRLLGSHHYGERWGRHWLDVVRFGESNGFERNFQRENAWPYRDWVIAALNKDMPYDEFVRMQLIGDQLVGGSEGAAATGFWVAGVHNTTVGGSERMKQLARQDEIEEVLATVGQSFVGLTFNCARCHDHKFDPITQKEYYQLASTISGLGHGERRLDLPNEKTKLEQLDQKLAQLRQQLSVIDNAARKQITSARELQKSRKSRESAVESDNLPTPLAQWEFDHDLQDSFGHLNGTIHGELQFEDGALALDGENYVSTAPLASDLSSKTLEAWVQLDDLDQRGGAAISVQTPDGKLFDAIVFGEQEPRRWMAGSNFFARTDSFEAAEETSGADTPVHVAIVYEQDGSILCYRNGQAYGHAIAKSPLQRFEAGGTQVLFGLRHKPAGGNRHLKGKLYRATLYDRALSPEEIAASAASSIEYISEEQLLASLDQDHRKQRTALKAQITDTTNRREIQAEKAVATIYTLTAGKGQTTNILLRGDPDNVGEVVSPATTAAIAGLPADFGLPADAPEFQRRESLAKWITHKNNPLFSRVIVNRIWHYHFGAGIVDTPNDFGFNGGRPSHPQLLEHLAWNFRDSGYRLKSLHRLMVTSSTYRQSVHGRSKTQWKAAAAKDANNRLLWRSNIRRLEAEALRDAILSVSGKLNTAAGGPSFKDVSVTLNNGTTYYAPLDVDGPEFFRRTVYRFNPRGGRSALLDTFDCPDPATMAPRRSITTTPLQSLSLMNNALALRMSEYFAERVREEAGEHLSEQITRAWRLAIAREPNASQRQLSEQLVRNHGLPALCRGLFNLNEFVVIE